MWGQSESSRAKPGLAQLSQFLTPADSTDKTSALTFLNVRVWVGSDLHLVQALAGPPQIMTTQVQELTHRREQGCSTEMLVDAPSATMVTLHHLPQVDSMPQ